MNSQTKVCQNCKSGFIIESDDFNFYEKMKVPAPTWCPQCRLVRRLNWQGYRILYKRKCDFTGDMVISTHRPDSLHKVYRPDILWSDKWDAKSYAHDVDFLRPFLEQFKALMQEVPFPSLYTAPSTMVRSDYCNAATELKDCYLCFRISGGEDNAYLNTVVETKQSLDCSFINNSELCYGSVRINKCYQAFFSQDCEDCNEIWFSKDLAGCSNCIGCINLRNKQYHIFNKPVTKEEYKKFVDELDLGSIQSLKEFQKRVDEFMDKQPRKQFHGRRNTNVVGDYISNSKNVRDSYMLNNGENLRYCQFLKDGPASECYDYSFFGEQAEMMYECCWSGWNANNCKFVSWLYTGHDVEYSFGCPGSGNMFGCMGIRKGEYCILNKQYSKEEYVQMIERIKKHMLDMPYKDRLGREYRYGEMLPAELSPWAYNETTAYEWFPLTKEEAVEKGFNWRDEDKREYQAATVELPDHIKDLPNDTTKEILKCVLCGMNYRLIAKEIVFYKRFNLPVPQQCPLCRDRARIALLNPMAIYKRTCVKCAKEIDTTYVPDRPEIVYCEQCYQAEVA